MPRRRRSSSPSPPLKRSRLPHEERAQLPPPLTADQRAIRDARAEAEADEVAVERQTAVASSAPCPYLGTIDRSALNFDFEKLCEMSLSREHVYACLVCGRHLQGRGKKTHAYTHSLLESHHVFMHLSTGQFYCLPDDYEIRDLSLRDIQQALNPTFTLADVQRLTTTSVVSRSLDGKEFIPGLVGLNDIKRTDFFNAVFQALLCIPPLVTFLLLLDMSSTQRCDPVARSLSELFRKAFNQFNFKGIISPHECIQSIAGASNKMFSIGKQGDPATLLIWLLQRLRRKLAWAGQSVVDECFGGWIQRFSIADGQATSDTIRFLYLQLELPPPAVFVDATEMSMANVEVSISELLAKFDGHTVSPSGDRRYRIAKLPPFLILVLKRFSENGFTRVKNQCVVSFPLKHLDMRPYCDTDNDNGMRYSLVASIAHEGKAHDGAYKAFGLHRPSAQWYEVHNLHVTPVMGQAVVNADSYIHIYEREKNE
ncbi:MAG: hypothetical protein KVP17_003767 [Porospora cf. gigantea B]|uniref:uncharacterized protein n=1 Tax=Porospora cf. gigantea B TaxID=2853592 RepID=UPI003571E91B|nr:MAG: hypothetical protein KVP17_003767 [Porospora cf. gigantea B]